ncbi:Dopamine D2-like receptor [Sesbania bispinosa]|nr:Dopamine D2-like receptor [Sesbania bispinosa]
MGVGPKSGDPWCTVHLQKSASDEYLCIRPQCPHRYKSMRSHREIEIERERPYIIALERLD